MIKISQMNKKNVGTLRAFFTVEVGGKIVVRDCKLIEGDRGLFVGMPSRQYEHNGEKKWSNIVQIVDQDLLEKIQNAAIQEYGGNPQPSSSDDDFPF